MRLEITLIGDVALRREGEEAPRSLPGASARVTLALLALERARGVTAERLAEALWPDGLPATWGSALRMTVSRVRSFVRDALGADAPDPIVAQGGRYRLELPDGVVLGLDIEDAEACVAAARQTLAAADAASAYRHAAGGADRLRGPFLAGRHGGWVGEQRDRLADLLVAALELTSEAAAAQGDAAAAQAAADEAVERAPLRESAHRAVMAAHGVAGNRGEALRAYQRLRRILAEELGVDPDAQTEAAYLRLLGPAPASRPARPADAPGGTGGPPPFVGREAELAALGTAWDRAAAGARHVVVITGEAGIGKSRLAAEAARRVSAEGGLVLFGRCDQEAIVPYQPIVEALDGYVAATPSDAVPVLNEEARAELGALLPSFDAPRATGHGGGRARLFDAVTALVVSVAAERPVLLVLDDLQWADGDTLLLVRHLLRRAGDAPVLAVAISRDHDVAPGSVLGDVIHALERDGWVRRLPLRGLGEADVRALLQGAPLQGNARSPRDQMALARRLVAETSGNPFLVTEMLRGGLEDEELAIPPSVHDLVASRLARLDGAATELLRAAAVAGAQFELDLVAAAAGLDEAAGLDALDVALGSGLVSEEAAERYRFPHDIVRRTLVAQLSGARRRGLHARLADAIESRRCDRLDAYAAVLAHHTSAAASPRGDRRAVDWSHAAAAQAAERRALAEVVRLERQALTHVPADDRGLRARVVTDLGVALLAAGDPSGERTLIEGATLARRHGRFDVLAPAALALADRAAERPGLRPDAAALVEAALDAPGVRDDEAGDLLRARLLARHVALGGTPGAGPLPGALLALRQRLGSLGGPDHLDERVAVAADLSILAEAAGDATAVVVAAHERAMAAALTGDDDTAQSCLQVVEEAAAKADDPPEAERRRGPGPERPGAKRREREVQRRSPSGPPPEAARAGGTAPRDGADWCRLLAAALAAEREAASAAMTGRFDDAAVAVDVAAASREAVDGPAAAATLALRHRTILAWMRGEAGPTDEDFGPDAERALLLLGRSERDRARLLVRDLATGVRPLPGGDERLHALGLTALVAAEVGDVDNTAESVRSLLTPHADLACGIGYRTFVGVASFHLGRLAAVAGDWADAERHMLAALRRYSALQARPWVAFTQSVLADVLEARGRPSDREWLAALRGESRWATATLGLRTL